RFASYAPLLARRGHTQWTPDLIYFDATDVFLTPNYFTQQLFGQHGGDRYHDTRVADLADGAKLVASTVSDSSSGEVVIKIVNGDDTAAALDVVLAGLDGNRTFAARRAVLTGPNADAVNADGQPPVVQPRADTMTITPTFTYDAPAHSLTVIRFARP